jgi:hypothetical protein
MAAIKHAAPNFIKEIPDKASLKIRQKTVAWDDYYLFEASPNHGGDVQAIPLTGPRSIRARDIKAGSSARTGLCAPPRGFCSTATAIEP